MNQQQQSLSEKQKTSLWSRFLRKLRAIIIAGVVVTAPIGLTIWIFAYLFTEIDKILRPVVTRIFGHEIIGVGFGVMLILVLLVGLITTAMIGKRIIRWGESMFARIPISRTLYVAIRQVMQSFSEYDKTGFKQVIMIEYPRRGVYSIGFVTNEYIDASGKKLINVFVPTTHLMTGFLQIADESEIIPTALTIEETIKMIVSVGRTSPKNVGDKMVEAKNEAAISDKH